MSADPKDEKKDKTSNAQTPDFVPPAAQSAPPQKTQAKQNFKKSDSSWLKDPFAKPLLPDAKDESKKTNAMEELAAMLETLPYDIRAAVKTAVSSAAKATHKGVNHVLDIKLHKGLHRTPDTSSDPSAALKTESTDKSADKSAGEEIELQELKSVNQSEQEATAGGEVEPPPVDEAPHIK